MKEHSTNVLFVVDQVIESKSKILGIVGTNRFKGVGDHTVKMKDIMKSNFKRIPHDMSLVEVLNIRKDNKVMYSPVVDENDKIVGIITNTSILNVLADIVPESEDY